MDVNGKPAAVVEVPPVAEVTKPAAAVITVDHVEDVSVKVAAPVGGSGGVKVVEH